MAIQGLDDGAGNIYSRPVEKVAPRPPPPPPPAVVGPQPYFSGDGFEGPVAAAPVSLNVPRTPNAAPPNPTVGLTAFGPGEDPTTNAAPANPTVGLTAFDDADGGGGASGVGQPIDRSAPDSQYDGAIVGGYGLVYPPGTSLQDVPAVYPDFASGDEPLYIFVNGVGNDIAEQEGYLHATANATGSRVIGIHNATNGMGTDIAQAAGDKLGLSDNPARVTLGNAIIDELDHGRPVHVAAHSQGAIITSGALNDVWAHYQLQGLNDDEIKAKLANVQVETFGGAASLFPDGPQYIHFVNYWDPVAKLGVNAQGVGAGDNAKVVVFNDPAGLTRLPPDWLSPHSYTDVYLPRREGKTFEEIYNDR